SLVVSVVAPTSFVIGQVFPVVVTVQNPGQSDAFMVSPGLAVTSGASLVNSPVGPTTTGPTPPVTISGSASQAFTWQVTALASGSVVFKGFANGQSCLGAISATGFVMTDILPPIPAPGPRTCTVASAP